MLYLTQPIPDPTEGAALIDRTDPSECWALKLEPNPAKLGRPIDQRIRLTPEVRDDLRARRKAAGLTQVMVSMQCGWNTRQVSFIECGAIKSIDPDDYNELLNLYASANERMAS